MAATTIATIHYCYDFLICSITLIKYIKLENSGRWGVLEENHILIYGKTGGPKIIPHYPLIDLISIIYFLDILPGVGPMQSIHCESIFINRQSFEEAKKHTIPPWWFNDVANTLRSPFSKITKLANGCKYGSGKATSLGFHIIKQLEVEATPGNIVFQGKE